MKPVEIYILSGFLGAGKTTLLQNILSQEKQQQRKIAVIMNELGEVSIDSNAVPEETPLKELLNGCVCCTIQGQLEVQLENMLQEYELDAIYIETTGVAHPVEVLDACMSPLFAEKLAVQSIITIIDTKRWQHRTELSIQLRKLLIEQVQHADVILLNKVDSLSESEKANLVSEIQSLSENGKLFMTEYANIPLSHMKMRKRYVTKPHEQAHVHDTLHMRTYVHTFSKPIDLESFEQFLKNMPDTIYRIKGYLSFTHSKDTYLFQYSYGMPLYIKEQMNMKNTLVFIGENLDHQMLKRELLLMEENQAE
ncbi:MULTISPECIES: CobW family GTP-binding protein [Metabacillus]|jgi:G3E family GTPase|uniref:GTP-binding protein n=1 Tax=Metabacillus rhizolycopersici TaxID=2875709 RepID=A0ABS7UL12_9BACI|nr:MULTISPECIES: GTP-binding protein [Metabacillus]MBZ5748782.1 GTP-binding protein [Metabacillus rhizolycopersici]MCM3652820.1 GTP-binding protein [Metabacillus litoralis]